jgi:hypothetical protein
MSVINGYCSLDDFLLWKTAVKQLEADTDDDAVIEGIIEAASRHIDNVTGRTFYPRVETRYYDTPSNTENDRVLWLDDDLLEMITVTNGDDTTLASTEYNLYPLNAYPKYAIRIKQSSDYYWEQDSDNNTEGVIDIAAIWGKHKDYSARGWSTGSTLNEGDTLSAADLTWTMTDASAFRPGQVIKIENELAIVSSISGDNVTVLARGANGSTAATHADSTAVTIWNVQDDIVNACLQIVTTLYGRRFGENMSGVATITAAGVVITPQDVPGLAREIIRNNSEIV